MSALYDNADLLPTERQTAIQADQARRH